MAYTMSFELADAICRPSAARNTTHKGTTKIQGEHFTAYMQRKQDDVHRFAAQVPLVVYSATLPEGPARRREVTAARGNLRGLSEEERFCANEALAHDGRILDAAGARGDKGQGVIGAGSATATTALSEKHQEEQTDAAASEPPPSLCSDRSDESDNKDDSSPTPTGSDDAVSKQNSLDGLLQGMLGNLDSTEASARSVLNLLHNTPDLDVDELEILLKPPFEKEGGCDTSTDSQHLRDDHGDNEYNHRGFRSTAIATPMEEEPSPARAYQLVDTTAAAVATAFTAAATAAQAQQQHNQARIAWLWQQFTHVRQSLDFIKSIPYITPQIEQWLASYTPQLREIALRVEQDFADLVPFHQHELQQFTVTTIYEQEEQEQHKQQLADADLDRHAAWASDGLDEAVAKDQRRANKEKERHAADLIREDFRAKIHAAAAVGSSPLSCRR
ncbi:hypothetical protein MN608_10632 [Microdochium nivale]|nr:hypothetical protein MN608_10632 [Microdochium nivale]